MVKMKIDKTKAYLQKALYSLPNTFKLVEVRGQINKIIRELEDVEKKEYKKAKVQNETPASQWKFILGQGLLHPKDSRTSLSIINKLIEDEEAKLKQIENKITDKIDDENMNLLD